MRWPIILAVIGIAVGVVGASAPLYLPGTAPWIWGIVFWAGIATIIGAVVWGVGSYLKFTVVPLTWSAQQERIPLIMLRDLIAEKGWDFKTETSLHILDFCDALRQGGLDGSIPFWGRRDQNIFDYLTRNEPLHPIRTDHWENFEIDPISLHKTADNFDVRTYCLRETSQKGHVDIHTEKRLALRWLKQNERNFKGKQK